MNGLGRIAAATVRIASLTSIGRTRREDAHRLDVHGAPIADLHRRMESAGADFERVAVELEKSIT